MNKNGTWILALATAAAVAILPSSASAQISLELRGGLQSPTGDLDDVADGNAGFGGDIFFSVNPQLSIYGGYGIENFDEDINSTGFEAGAKFILSSGSGGVLPWIRAGAILHELEFANGATSDRGLGFQTSAGVDIPLGEVLSFSPAVRYQRFSPEFDTLIGDFEETASFFSLDFGLHIHPGG